MSPSVVVNEIIWRPSAERIRDAQVTAYRDWLAASRGRTFDGYEALWQWSVDSLEDFWQSIWDWFGFSSPTPYVRVLDRHVMPRAKWFEGATLNYTAEVFRNGRLADDVAVRPAIVFRNELGDQPDLAWPELERQVASLAATLTASGVVAGDRVAAYLPNIPETIVAFLAVASIGAVWSVCAPDMGPVGVLDRFRQIEPEALITCDAYRYGGKRYDRVDTVVGLLRELPTIRTVIVVRPVDADAPGPSTIASQVPSQIERCLAWADCIADDAPLACAMVPFDHPLWIVYSSGTTGTPKAIVHGHGGAALVGIKDTRLQLDVAPTDRFHWYSSSGWIMWNSQVSALLCGATVCIYDGNAGSPDWNPLWRFVAERRIDFFGAGAAFYASCLKAGVEPGRDFDLSHLRTLGSTGSPLSEDAYRWIYARVKPDLWLSPISGGTDLAAAFICGSVILPLRVGEMQCRGLGAAVHAFDEQGRALIDEVGELVCTKPIPSMPLRFWNDAGDRRLIESYYDTYPGVWRHGDWIRLIPHVEDDGQETLGAIIYGRSDATINRHGIRMGTAELYRAVEALPEVLDSLVVDLEYLGRESWMALFVVLREEHLLDDPLTTRINGEIRKALSARHVPNDVYAIASVPRTLSGKKLELPVKRLLMGQPIERVVNRDAMANPESMDWFIALAARRAAGEEAPSTPP